MTTTQTKQQTECLISVALNAGVSIDEVKQANKTLLQDRPLGNCLQKGDVISIPASAPAQPLKLNAHNQIVVTKKQYRLPLTLLDHHLNPVEGVEVRCVHLNSPTPLKSTTNSEGIVFFDLPLSCEKGLIAYIYDNKEVIRTFSVGTLTSPNTDAGVKQRIDNISCRTHRSKLDSNGCQNVIDALADKLDTSSETILDTLTGSE